MKHVKLFENFTQTHYSDTISKKRDNDENWSMYDYDESELNDPAFIRRVIQMGTDIEIKNLLNFIFSKNLENKLIPRQSILFYFMQWMIQFDKIDLLEKLEDKLVGKLNDVEKEKLKKWVEHYSGMEKTKSRMSDTDQAALSVGLYKNKSDITNQHQSRINDPERYIDFLDNI
jgi:hypothetical protein